MKATGKFVRISGRMWPKSIRLGQAKRHWRHNSSVLYHPLIRSWALPEPAKEASLGLHKKHWNIAQLSILHTTCSLDPAALNQSAFALSNVAFASSGPAGQAVITWQFWWNRKVSRMSGTHLLYKSHDKNLTHTHPSQPRKSKLDPGQCASMLQWRPCQHDTTCHGFPAWSHHK